MFLPNECGLHFPHPNVADGSPSSERWSAGAVSARSGPWLCRGTQLAALPELSTRETSKDAN